MEDWMRRRIEVFKREKESCVVKLSKKALQALMKNLPYTAAVLTTDTWIEIIALVEISQFEEWYDEH